MTELVTKSVTIPLSNPYTHPHQRILASDTIQTRSAALIAYSVFGLRKILTYLSCAERTCINSQP